MSAHDVKYPLAQRLLYIVFLTSRLCSTYLLSRDSISYSVTTHDAGRSVRTMLPQYEK